MDSREKKFKSVLVYNKPIKDEGIKKLARFQGIWISQIPQHTSPTELWFYDLGDEPKQSSSSRLQGSWGFRPGLDGNFTDFQPEDLWVFPPLVEPPQEFLVRGKWVYPKIKANTSQMDPGETVFLDLCRSNKIVPLDIGGIWRIYFKKELPKKIKAKYPSSIFQIKVKTANDKTLNLFPLKPTDTIAEIKEKILIKDSTLPMDQYLLFDGIKLDEDSTLESCNITHGSTLEFEGMKTFVQEWDGTLMELKVTPERTIQSIKDELSRRIGVSSDDLRLSFEGALLSKPTGKLHGYRIQNKDTIRLEPIHLRVKEPNMKDIIVPVSPKDSILDVKKAIAKRGGIAVEAQRLMWNGLELEDSHTVTQYKLRHRSALDLSAIQVFVEHWNGKVFEFDIRPNATVNDLKKLILATQSIPIIHQHLHFNGAGPLDSTKTLSELFISHGSTLQLAAMQVIVKTRDKRDLVFTVDPKDRINDLKYQIQEQIGIPIDRQHLTYKKRFLGGGTSLEENRIKHCAKLRLSTVGELSIVTRNGQTYSFNANLDHTLEFVKETLNTEFGISTIGQYLCLNGNYLDEKKTLLANGVRHGFILSLQPMQVLIQETGSFSFGEVPINIDSSNTLMDVKKIIEEELEVPFDQQCLSFRGQMLGLDDLTSTLAECKIGNKDRLVLERRK